MVKTKDKFKTNHTGDNILRVSKIYNKRFFLVNIEDTNRNIICVTDKITEEHHLLFAHVGSDNTLLKEIKG